MLGPAQGTGRTDRTGSGLSVKSCHLHGGQPTLLDDQVTPLSVERQPGTVETAVVEMVAFQRRLAPSGVFRFTVGTTDAGFYASRTSGGARLHHTDDHLSTIDLPVVESWSNLL